MNNAEDKNAGGSPEIDLLYFLRPIGNLFKKAGSFIAGYFQHLALNKWIVAAILLIATAAGYSLRYILPDAYETEGIFLSHSLPTRFCEEIINNMNKYASGKNKPVLLAKRLDILPQAAASIVSIRLERMADTLFVDKRDTAVSMFRIRLILKDTAIIEDVQKGLVDLLENNEFSLKRKQAHRISLEALKADLGTKLKSLDSVKVLVNNSIVPRATGQGIILGEPINPITVYQAQVSYYRDQLRIGEELATIDNIEVLQPFFKVSTYNYPKFDSLTLQFFLWGLIAALLLTPFVGREVPKQKK
jgi:hypothetical protein